MGRTRQIVTGIGVMLPLIGGIALTKVFQVRAAIAQHANFAPPPDAITTAKAEKQSWRKTFTAVGSLAPVNGATLGTEVIARVAKINVESGQEVEAGQVLVEMDTNVEQATLKDALAWQERARRRVERYAQVKDSKVLSPDTVDDARMEYERASAQGKALQFAIERKNIIAPFAGTVGIRQVNVGDVILPGTAVIPLHSLDTLYVNFTLPQQAVPSLHTGVDVAVTVDSFPGEKFKGTVTAIDPNVSESTRSINLQATIANPGRKLRAGMFASVTLELPVSQDYVVVPITAINYAPYGDSVYVVGKLKNPKGEEYTGVSQKIVQLGPKKGDYVAITSGLEPGEEVASTGVFKLHQGSAVNVNNSAVPPMSLNPTPVDS